MDRVLKISCAALIVLATTLLLNSCRTAQPRNGTTIDQMQYIIGEGIQADKAQNRSHASHIPHSVSDAMLPTTTSHAGQTENAPSEHRFDVDANNMPAKAFFMGLVEGTPNNMVVSPSVTGEISLHLKNVTIDDAMDAVRDIYGYEYQHTSYGYEVLPQELRTQIFTVNYLDVRRSGKSVTMLAPSQISDLISGISVGGGTTGAPTNPTAPSSTASGSEGPGSKVDTRSEINFWRDLKFTLTEMMGNKADHTVVVNPQAGIVMVRAFPSELHKVARYLDKIQSSMQRQVILEAKILEVTLNNQFQSGIDWSLFGRPSSLAGAGPAGSLADTLGPGGVTQTSSVPFPDENLSDFNSMFTFNIRGSFGDLIKLLQEQGNVQVLSSPRISTVNNQKAVIKVGQDEFFVTSVSTTNTIVGNNTLPSQDVGLTPFFSGITLDVTPQISKDGTVVIHIHPSVSKVTNQQKQIVIGTTATSTPNLLSLPLALSTIREADSIVRAKTGSIIVMGGLMQSDTQEQIAETPVLGKIPFFGTLFRRTQQIATKSELVILIRPIIVDRKTWGTQLKKECYNMHKMDRGFHVGGYPEIFGDEAEERRS